MPLGQAQHGHANPRECGPQSTLVSIFTGETAMPTYHIEMMEGRTEEQKKKLVQEITRVTVEVLGGSAESVDILITDVKRENWATGGKLWSEPRT
jgi:4-oxalocrotonate tautomerase